MTRKENELINWLKSEKKFYEPDPEIDDDVMSFYKMLGIQNGMDLVIEHIESTDNIKKPIFNEKRNAWICPSCLRAMIFATGKSDKPCEYHYCSYCGQEIDWN